MRGPKKRSENFTDLWPAGLTGYIRSFIFRGCHVCLPLQGDDAAVAEHDAVSVDSLPGLCWDGSIAGGAAVAGEMGHGVCSFPDCESGIVVAFFRVVAGSVSGEGQKLFPWEPDSCHYSYRQLIGGRRG